jgi:hypothetical protein
LYFSSTSAAADLAAISAASTSGPSDLAAAHPRCHTLFAPTPPPPTSSGKFAPLIRHSITQSAGLQFRSQVPSLSVLPLRAVLPHALKYIVY